MAIPAKYSKDFQRLGIDGDDFITLMECADHALHNKRIRESLGNHLDLNDTYLDELAGKLRAFMNPEGNDDAND
jgi:hypothetical protein